MSCVCFQYRHLTKALKPDVLHWFVIGARLFLMFLLIRVQLYHLWQAADAANLTPTLTLQNLITRILDHIPYIPLISCKNPPLTLQVIALSKKPAVAVAVRVLAGTCEQQGLVLPRLTAEVKLSCVEYCCQCALRVKS